MIIYESSLNQFIDNCNSVQIVEEIQKGLLFSGFNISNQKEIDSWKESLPFVAKALDKNDLSKDINVAIEYKLDITSNRIDILIYGKNYNDEDNLVVVELKQWSNVKNSNKPNFVYAFGGAGSKDYLHPSYQAYRYESILNGFNEYIQENNVSINSCSYLHNLDNIYESVVDNKTLFPFIEKSPIFLKNDSDKLYEFVKKYVSKGNRKLLYEIDNSRIRPSKNFASLMFKALKGEPIFTLDDEQATSVSTIVSETLWAIEHNRRATIIIKGGPGTGKSVVAINAMGQLLNNKNGSIPCNVCYCTPNFTPRALFSNILINNDYKKSAIANLFKKMASFSKSSEFDYDCIIVDEAHRAFTWKFGNGVKKNVDMIDKIFYASRVNVFFIDEDQIVTKDDYLTVNRIRKYAEKYKSEIFEAEELHLTSQFRCIGGENYINFINSFLGYNNLIRKYKPKNYEFKVFDSPSKMYEAIKEKQNNYPKSRLLAGYTHNWESKKDDSKFDFNLENGKFKMKWNKATELPYILDEEQKDRIGSIHTIQGVDMDFAGVIIGKDIIYKNGQITFDPSKNAKTDKASGISKVDFITASKMIRNTYKVLLTRAVYGTYVYCEDEELNKYLKSFLN